MNTKDSPSSPSNPSNAPSGTPNRAGASRKTNIFVFTLTVLVFGGLNYWLYRTFSPKSRPTGIVVAAFRADFQPDKPKEGWRYLWNAKGPIGFATNYVDLQWNGMLYTADNVQPFPNPPPARYLRITEQGGHPGQGPGQTRALDGHFVIAAFRVTERAPYWITNSVIARRAGGKNGSVHLRRFVNDAEVGRSLYCATRERVSFDCGLGTLAAGDVVYVAAGPNEVDIEDGFEWDFTIVR